MTFGDGAIVAVNNLGDFAKLTDVLGVVESLFSDCGAVNLLT